MFDYSIFQKRWPISMVSARIYNFKTLDGASKESISFKSNCQKGKDVLSQISHFHLFGNEWMSEA